MMGNGLFALLLVAPMAGGAVVLDPPGQAACPDESRARRRIRPSGGAADQLPEIEQPPGCPACGQPPQAAPVGIGADLCADAPTANADSCFSTRWLQHDGQARVTPSRMSISNRLPQSAQAYS